jgi:vacuolar-type H+-ATPase subunit E/Vma4
MTAVRAVPDAHRAALEPVHRALLEDARTEAERLVADATRAAELVVAEAARDADEEVERARQRGIASARARAEQALGYARNAADTVVLEAKEGIRLRIHQATHAAVLELRGDDRYPALVRELEHRAHNQLGPDVQIEYDPDGRGGIVAIDGHRRVNYTLPDLADRALDAHADEVARLWA